MPRQSKTITWDPFWQGDDRHEARNRLSAIVGRENHLAAGAAHQPPILAAQVYATAAIKKIRATHFFCLVIRKRNVRRPFVMRLPVSIIIDALLGS